MLTNPAMILLYLVLLNGKTNIALIRIRERFGKVQEALLEKTKFEGSSFAYELKGQEGHRIQRLGEQIPVYRFSHPTYEEALIGLAEKNSTCALIAETCLTVILKDDSSMAADIFRRFVIRYPEFIENRMTGVLKLDFNNFDESAKLDLTRKMLLSEHKVFQKTARELYPIDEVINALFEEGDGQFFLLRLRMLNRRKDELVGKTIEWSKIFTTKRIRSMHPSEFLMCYDLAYAIDAQLAIKIEGNFLKSDVIRKFILLPTEGERKKLDNILSNTVLKGIYSDLKDKIPEDILGERINKYKYAGVLRKYILKRESPKGTIYLDEGAMKAAARGAKIYPVGVTDVEGEFENGDIVYLSSKKNGRKVLSLVEMCSEKIRKYKGYRSNEIYEIADEVIPTVVSRPNFREYIGWRLTKRGS